MKPEKFLKGRVVLRPGDCLKVLATMPECSIDSVVTDPPYHLSSIVKRFGSKTAAPAKAGKTGAYARASAGFMGQKWDGGDVAFRVETWEAVFRVMKPGAHLIAFGGTRTYHRMVCAIEDAGFEIRDQIGWAFGSGFAKSHDVSKGIDKAAGAERTKVVGSKLGRRGMALDGSIQRSGFDHAFGGEMSGTLPTDILAPATDAASRWQGWGTALKPAWEPIVLARKPLARKLTVAENVLKYGTGAINVDACRIDTEKRWPTTKRFTPGQMAGGGQELGGYLAETDHDGLGRWPANIVHDGSEEVVAAFPQTETHAKTKADYPTDQSSSGFSPYSRDSGRMYESDSGTAARFFYSAKADSDDRLGSKHPTVKPVDLMQWLVRLVTPPGGTVLDLFAGTGTTGEAAWREGFNAILIEREAEYQKDIRRRMRLCLSGPDERARESIKAKTLDKPIDAGPLFGGSYT